MKPTGLLILVLFFSLILNAQMDDRIYKIRLSSLKGEVWFEKFDKVASYGVLTVEPAVNGFNRVYIGNYIGRQTAQQVLNMIKRRGFRSAYLVLDNDLYDTDSPEDQRYYTFQFAAVKRLNISKFINKLSRIDQALLHIRYDNGFYKYSIGMYDPLRFPKAEENYRQMAFDLGFADGFAKQITR